ncbi:CidA-associated membrane protein CidB [Klebsiella pneumoniae ISC21]|nr:CidA-associated membrane protein CidB [Klebsiella pneumoniae ISC21]
MASLVMMLSGVVVVLAAPVVRWLLFLTFIARVNVNKY